jgi:hypothetical protein
MRYAARLADGRPGRKTGASRLDSNNDGPKYHQAAEEGEG